MNTNTFAEGRRESTAKISLRNAVIALILMATAALLALMFTPHQKLTSVLGKLDLETAIPAAFGDWKVDTSSTGVLVNPQQSAMLDKLYSQIVSRTYINSKGDRIMLSVAYGDDQRDGLALHYPEVCYPAQGFQLLANTPHLLLSGSAKIPVRRLETRLGEQRYEPITYWTMIGTTSVRGGLAKKLAELRYGLQNKIPDGLLFRVSSLDKNSPRAFALHQEFVEKMLQACEPEKCLRLAGVKLTN